MLTGVRDSRGTKHVNDALEGKPLRNLLATTQHLAELSTAELFNVEATSFRMFSGDVALFLCVDEIQGRNRLHGELRCTLLRKVLSVIGAIKIVATQR